MPTTPPDRQPSTLEIHREGVVARVSLNRPEVRNAFNDDVIAELRSCFAALGADSSLRGREGLQSLLGKRPPAWLAS